ncbi:MAG: phospholipase D family protein [Chloroflexota bacterium]
MQLNFPEYELVPFPIENKFVDVIRQAHEKLLICTPYIKNYGVNVVLENVHAREIRVLTNLDLPNITSDSFDLTALLKLWDKFKLTVSSLGKLHAKIYIADSEHALITSANLTHSGLRENYEYGIVLHERNLVGNLAIDMQRYFDLGNIFERERIAMIKDGADEIKALRKEVENTPQARETRKILEQKTEVLQTVILENRITAGRTVNTIFSDTIRFLLSTKGPLSTVELHPLIQNIHPDICDDTIDRVINGEHFGKKWKHLVRNAQQSLKGQGVITLSNGKWVLVEG